MKKKFLSIVLTLILCCTAMIGLAGCTNEGKKFTVATTATANANGCYTFTKGAKIEDSLSGWTFTYPSEKTYELKVVNGQTTRVEIDIAMSNLTYANATSATRTAENKPIVTCTGYNVATETEEGEYRTITFVYCGQTASFKYVVVAASTTPPANNPPANDGQNQV